MKKMITIHSFKGGTGKTQLSVNIATILAKKGKKVALFDLDLRAPTLHEVFNPKKVKCYINDVLSGSMEIEDCMIDNSEKIGEKDKLYVCFANSSTEAIREMVSRKRKWEIEALKKLLIIRKKLLEEMNFDYIIVDTSPGIIYLSINAVVAADLPILVTTLDESDVNGTNKIVRDLYKVFEKKPMIIVNKVLNTSEEKMKLLDELRKESEVIGILPCFCEIGIMKRSSIFAIEKPQHQFTKMLEDIVNKII
jgi:MinD-like ATPase involved in chromosome partitioning or flagellar assembly